MIAAALAAVAALAAWFVPRARLGARVRALAGVRLRAVDRVGALLTRAAARRAALASLGGVALAGPPGATAGALALAAEPLLRRRGARLEARALDRQAPDALRAAAAALRAGRSLPQALEAARDEAAPPMRALLDRLVRRLALGRPADEALAALGAEAGGSEALRAAAETMRVARAAGSELPAVLDHAVAALAERERIAADRRAATAQARSSAAIVAALPLAFFALLGAGARDQLRLLFGEPVGWTLLGAAAVLELAGLLWMRRLLG